MRCSREIISGLRFALAGGVLGSIAETESRLRLSIQLPQSSKNRRPVIISRKKTVEKIYARLVRTIDRTPAPCEPRPFSCAFFAGGLPKCNDLSARNSRKFTQRTVRANHRRAPMLPGLGEYLDRQIKTGFFFSYRSKHTPSRGKIGARRLFRTNTALRKLPRVSRRTAMVLREPPLQ